MATSRSLPVSLALLWLVGNALRLPILAVPPVIPALRSQFALSGTEIGILTGLPIILFAAAALVGSRLVARLGVVAAVITGLLLTAAGCAARGAAFDVMTLFAATVVMGAGVAVIQPAMPALVGRWTPRHIVLGTGIYTNGLLAGEIWPVALFPFLFPLLGNSWRAIFFFWAIPIVAIALLVMATAQREPGANAVAATRWWPDWPARDLWRLGLICGASNALYFASNAFLPGYLNEANRSDLISPALTALNVGQIPASLLLIGFARHLERKTWPFILGGALGLAGLAGIAATASAVTVASAALLGFAAGGVFALVLTLPPLLSTPQEVARVSAAMFTISYTSGMVVSVISGAAWDFTGAARFAFLPIALATLPLILLAPAIKFDRKPSVGVPSE
ncbi:MAG TPA: MFS transporter [Xanthobacteraceae bacterium]|nr:MFS transporter [Xanthobacteraceae bacterium]